MSSVARTLSPLSILLVGTLGVTPVALARSTEGWSTPYPEAPAQPIKNVPAWLGRLTVTNTAGGPVTLSVEGLAPRALATWETATLSVTPGQRRVKVSYVQFGVEHVLENRRVDLLPNGSAYVAVRAERSARILIRNNYDIPATVTINDRVVATLTPHEARVLTTPAGSARLVMTANSRILDQKQMTLVPFAEPVWTVDPPRVADLVISNPLPIPVVLTCDRGLVRTVAPRGQTVYDDLPLGSFHLTARRVTGEYIDDATTAIRYDITNMWRVDAPTTGIVVLDNDNRMPTRLYVDGALRESLSPGEDERLTLPLGWHELTAMDAERHRVLSTWIEVRPYDTAEVRIAAPVYLRSQSHEDHHDGYHDDHHRDNSGDAVSARDDDLPTSEGCALPPR